MFTRKLTHFALFLALYAVLLVVYIVDIQSDDYARYRELIDSATPSQGETGVDQAQQRRTEISKRVWRSKGSLRLQLLMESPTSVLKVTKDPTSTEIVEELDDVYCVIQEDLYYTLPDGREATVQDDGKLFITGSNPAAPEGWLSTNDPQLTPMQEVRVLNAKRARLYYQSSHLVAEDVTITRFYTTGHTVDTLDGEQRMVMEGTADTVEFNLEENDFNFRAHQLKAIFYTSRGLF